MILDKLSSLQFISGKYKARSFIALCVFIVVYLCFHFEVFHRFELVTYDYRCIMRPARPTHPSVVIIEISDDSMTKIGRWPWERSWHAALIKILKEYDVKAVAFDVIFSEPSQPDKDQALSKSIKQAGNVYLAQVLEKSQKDADFSVMTSIKDFTQFAKGQGHINLQPDRDGVMRRIPLIARLNNGTKVPQLSFKLFLDQMGCDLDSVVEEKNQLRIPRNDGTFISVPLDEKKNILINWAGKWADTFEHYSYIDIIRSYTQIKNKQTPLVDLNKLKGKLCYVGTSATGLYDIRPTPLEPSYPAVGVNLHVLENMLQGKFIRPLNYKENILIFLVLVLMLFEVMKFKSFFRIAFSILLIAVFYLLLALFLFYSFGIWINIVYSYLLIFLTYFCVTIYNQLAIQFEKARLMKLATRDSLTGLFNIGHFKLLLKAEIATIALRREKNLSIVMGDVDNFKKTNDTYGHVTGDAVLKEVAQSVRSNCRALDVAARYGGEEFILMLPGADVNEAFKVADKIRKSIEQKSFTHELGSFSTSISIGVTQVSPDDKDIELLVARADRALYEAKHTGKNKVVIAKDSPIITH